MSSMWLGRSLKRAAMTRSCSERVSGNRRNVAGVGVVECGLAATDAGAAYVMVSTATHARIDPDNLATFSAERCL